MDRLEAELILPTRKIWFDMIREGVKKEEYREIKPYYMSRFKNIFAMVPYTFIPSGIDRHILMFRNGYSKSSPSFLAECSLDIHTGRAEWGAAPGKDYYVLKIHRIFDGIREGS